MNGRWVGQSHVLTLHHLLFAFQCIIFFLPTEDGFIDEYDLRKTMIQLRLKFTDTDVEEMLNEFAPLRDGPPRIDFEDFLSIIK